MMIKDDNRQMAQQMNNKISSKFRNSQRTNIKLNINSEENSIGKSSQEHKIRKNNPTKPDIPVSSFTQYIF